MIEFPSYPKVHTLGHREIDGILEGEIYLQEKIDGSQINFMWDNNGVLHVKSKGSWQFGGPDNRVEPDKMFNLPISRLLDMPPQDEFVTFRGEVITKPKQNVLKYDTVPEGWLVIFDILDRNWNPITEYQYNGSFEFMQVPLFGPIEGDKNMILALISKLIKEPPLLGGDMREGIVVKNYNKFTRDGKIMVGKYVVDTFKEKHNKEWGESNPGRKDVIQGIIDNLNTEARFQKAVQHLREEDKLEDSPKDIGPLMKEVKRDILDEEKDWIVEQLVKEFLPQIERGLGRGLPEWYKNQLLERV